VLGEAIYVELHSFFMIGLVRIISHGQQIVKTDDEVRLDNQVFILSSSNIGKILLEEDIVQDTDVLLQEKLADAAAAEEEDLAIQNFVISLDDVLPYPTSTSILKK
jgi:hypothetical protein